MKLRRKKLLAIVLLVAAATQASAGDDLTRAVADGEPWEMFVVKRKVSNILVFKADGHGTISDSMVSIHPTWRAVDGGICIKPDPTASEKCLVLTRSKEGIVASQGGRPVFVLKR